MELVIHPTAASAYEQLSQVKTVSRLLHGPYGVGLSTLASELARRLICGGCADMSCADCVRLRAGSHDRFLGVVPDEKGKIGIEAIISLRHRLSLQQHAGVMQLVVIDGADTMTLPAQNALLKTLEEPPEGTQIILTATKADQLLPTIRSRVQAVYFPTPGEAAVSRYLSEHLKLKPSEAQELARLSRGLPALAMRMHQDAGLQERHRAASSYLEHLTASDLFERLLAAGEIAKDASVAGEVLALLPGWAGSRLRQTHNTQFGSAAQHVQERMRANVSPKTALEAFAVELPC